MAHPIMPAPRMTIGRWAKGIWGSGGLRDSPILYSRDTQRVDKRYARVDEVDKRKREKTQTDTDRELEWMNQTLYEIAASLRLNPQLFEQRVISTVMRAGRS